MMLAFTISLIFVLTMTSSALSLSEIAFFSLPQSKVKSFRHQLDPKKRLIARLLSNSKNLLVTIFLLNTIMNVLVQDVTSNLFGPDGSWGLKVAVPLAILLIFGELLPKYCGLLYNETVSIMAAPIFETIQKVTNPISRALTGVADFFSRILFFFMKAEQPLTQHELEHALTTSQSEGLLHSDEVNFIHGYLSLEERQVKDLMIPRNDVPIYSIASPITTLAKLLSTWGNVLVCQGIQPGSSLAGSPLADADRIIGIVRAKDFFTNKPKIQSAQDILSITNKPFYIPETTSTKILLQLILQHEEPCAVAVDEYGAMSGLITRKELLEAMSAQDLQNASNEYTHVSKQAIIASGKMSLQDLRELFDVALESQHHAVTVSGYVIEQLDHIPKSGEVLEQGSLFFRVLAAEPTRIVKLYIQKGAAQKGKPL